MAGWSIVLLALAYVGFLFVVAHWGDRHPQALRRGLGHGGGVYALSLAVYCTSWTFFGSVGLATTSGLDFLAIYVGPVLMVTLGYPLLVHVVEVTKRERITSVADFLASRYGKNTGVGALAAVIAVLGTLPYVALQLRAISTSLDIMVNREGPSVLEAGGAPIGTTLAVAAMLAVFAVLFGTRHTDATEHQDGMVLAVAMESLVKLAAFLGVGLFVTFYLFDGFGDLMGRAAGSAYVANTFQASIDPSTFVVFAVLSTFAFLLLPRQFHIGVVENRSPEHLRTARWMFPLYLAAINLFVVPVALAGMLTFGQSVDADAYVLALPLAADAEWVSALVLLGGLSAATAMVIVACVALAIMISNNIVLPLLVGPAARGRRAMAPTVLAIRRSAIAIVCALAFAYSEVAQGSAALAQFGLLSFAAIAQFAPAFLLGLFWRRANARGAVAGMAAGFAVWGYTLLLPTLLAGDHALVLQGPGGLDWARPQALFGLSMAPLQHGVLVSLLANLAAFALASLTRASTPMERMQAASFSFHGRNEAPRTARPERAVRIDELVETVASYLGENRARRAFAALPQMQERAEGGRELASDEVVAFAEQLLASAIGAASSRLVMSLLLSRNRPTGETAIRLLDDASQAIQQNHDVLTTALDQVEQGIAVFDADVRLASWNRTFRNLLALSDDRALPGTALSAIVDDLAPCLTAPAPTGDELMRALLRPGDAVELRLGPDGGDRILESVSRPLPGGGVVVTLTDMTERQRAADALRTANETLERRVRERTEALTHANLELEGAREAAEAANRSKTRFLAAVGHDILQPLNAARLYASSLSERLALAPGDADPKGRALADNVDQSLESVEDILEAVLAISRLDAGALRPNPARVSVERLFRRLEVEFRPAAEAKGLAFTVVPNRLAVRSDVSMLHRLLQNLVSNAIRYTVRGKVTLDARVKRDRLVFEVRDTGPGIAPGDRERIFREFQRLPATKAQGAARIQGLGLGLSIVERLAHALEHPLTLDSTVGRGSVFQVSVPLSVEPETPSLAPDIPRIAGGATLAGMHLVCLDNDERILDGMERLLTQWECRVTLCSDPAALLAQPDVLRDCDAILADYHLDEADGLETIHAARALAGPVPAALLTADRSVALRRRADAAGVTVLNKPIKPAALRALLVSLPRRRRVEDGPDVVPA